jgi:hypothetical protein
MSEVRPVVLISTSMVALSNARATSKNGIKSTYVTLDIYIGKFRYYNIKSRINDILNKISHI